MLTLLSANKVPVPFLIDDEDLPIIGDSRWRVYQINRKNLTRYVMSEELVDGRQRRLYLHRLIMDASPGVEVDHINSDGLDNRRSNLRVCTHALNLANQRPQLGRSSHFKGVSYYKRDGTWEASIKVDGRKRRMGCFKVEEDAARAYDAAATAAWGEHARLNLSEVS